MGDVYSAHLLRHPENSTVAMEIIKRFDVGDGTVKLKVAWWNIGRCHKPTPMAVFQSMRIPLKKLQEFLPFKFDEQLSDKEFERLSVKYNNMETT